MKRAALVLLAALIAAWIGAWSGARLLNALSTEVPRSEEKALVQAQNRWSLDGGLWAALLVAYAVARRLGVDPYRIADLAAPGVALGIAAARWGCFRQGCCYGRPTTAPWGITVAWGSPAQQEHWSRNPFALFSGSPTIHPTQLYELTAALVIAAAAAIALIRVKVPAGVIAAGAWSAFAIWRLVNDALRSPATLTLPWTIVLHVIALLCGLLLLRHCLARELFVRPVDL